MEKFESQVYRKKLADEIKQVRTESGRDMGRQLLKQEHESEIYQASVILKELKRNLPEEYQAKLNSFLTFESQESLAENFEITDISDKLSIKHRLVIEAGILENLYYHSGTVNKYSKSDNTLNKLSEVRKLLFPNKEEDGGWGIESGPDLFNDISDGDFYNNHNFTHVANGLGYKRDELISPFDPASILNCKSSEETSYLHVCAGYNGCAKQIDKALIILSSKNLATRKFIETYFDMNRLLPIEARENYRGEVGYKSIDNTKSPIITSTQALLFLADYPIICFDTPFDVEGKEIRWNEFASKIINLANGKMYSRKQTVVENEEVEKSIDYYRDLAKERYSSKNLTSDKEMISKGIPEGVRKLR